VQVLIWDVESQPNRHAVLGATDSRPDLVCFLIFLLVRFKLKVHFGVMDFGEIIIGCERHG
jgi:hypothetical protein